MRFTPLKLALLLCCMTSSYFAFSQIAGTNGFSVKVVGVDHVTPLEGQQAALFEDYTFAGDISYYRWLGNSFALAIPVRFGVARLPMNNTVLGDNRSFLSLDATGQFHPFISKWKLSPYLLAGIGGFLDFNTDINPQIPLGLGFNIKLGKSTYLQLQSEYRLDFEDLRSNYMHSAGILVNLWDAAKKEDPIILPPPDKDGDGVADVDDKCPDIAGLAAYSGCPDTDGDGIIDQNDACPTLAGLTAFRGCPDTDADGLPDPEDDCPTQFGPKENRGCPLADADGDGILDADDECPQQAGSPATNGCPDTDGDGIKDSADRCPTVAGTARNNGCPEIEDEVIETLNFVAQNIQFETGKATLKEISFSILDKVYDILLQYPNYSVAIGGHTDSIGGAEINQLLSERRAKSCYDYLVRKGIAAERMNYVGYGETRPIATNKYKDGREQNRRVEFNLFLK